MKLYAYCNYFTYPGFERIQILSYDGDKYYNVKCEDGSIKAVKRGYITKDIDGTKFFNRKFWFILSGGDSRKFKPKSTKTEYRICTDKYDDYIFGNKQEAIRIGISEAERLGEEVFIFDNRTIENNYCYRSSSGSLQLYVNQHGQAYQYSVGHSRRYQSNYIKYLKGFGKCYNNRRA